MAELCLGCGHEQVGFDGLHNVSRGKSGGAFDAARDHRNVAYFKFLDEGVQPGFLCAQGAFLIPGDEFQGPGQKLGENGEYAQHVDAPRRL